MEVTGRFFKIWAYTASHNTLVLRSQRRVEDEFLDHNIDIEFVSVSMVNLPSSFVIMEFKISNYRDTYIDLLKDELENVFEIVTDKGVFYVIAVSVLIGKNNWPSSQCRIDDPLLAYDQIILKMGFK